MTLPILKMPYLVIQQLLQTMGFLDLFLLTRTSTKMKRIVQVMNRTPKHYLYVTIEKSISIQIQSETNEEYDEEIRVEEYKSKRRFTFNMDVGFFNYFSPGFRVFNNGKKFVVTYWNDIKAGCIELCNDLVEVFNTPVRGVTLGLDEIENYQNEINWTNSTFPGLIMFRIDGSCNFQDYMWMIKNVKAEELRFEMEPKELPEDKSNLEVIPLELEYIKIEYGQWISLQQLQAIKSDYIYINNFDLTDSDINVFTPTMHETESSSEITRKRGPNATKKDKDKDKYNEWASQFMSSESFKQMMENMIRRAVEAAMTNVETKFGRLNSEVAKLDDDLGKAKEKIQKIEKQLENQYAQMKKVEEIIGGSSTGRSFGEDYAEVKERNRSLVFLHVPEARRRFALENNQEDLKRVNEILMHIDAGYSPVAVYRMGKLRDDGNRLIKVVMPCSISQREILAKANRLRSFNTGNNPPVYIRRSMSPNELKEFREKREEKKRQQAQLSNPPHSNDVDMSPVPVTTPPSHVTPKN